MTIKTLFAAVMLAFALVPATAQTYTQDFETVNNEWFQQPVKGDACAGTTVEISEARAHAGKRAAKLSYKLSGQGNVQLLSNAWPTVVSSGDKLHVSFWVYGSGHSDFTGGTLLLVDADNETFSYWQMKDLTAALGGSTWQHVEADIDINKPTGHWGGNNDGVIKLPLKLIGFGLDYHKSVAAQGEVFVDDLVLTGAPVKASAVPAAVTPPALRTAVATPTVSLTLSPSGQSPELFAYPPGSSITAHVQASSPPDTRGFSLARIVWTATDFDGATIAQGTTKLDAGGAGDIALVAPKAGVVYVTASLEGTTPLATAAKSFAVYTTPSTPAAPLPTLYGVCTHYHGLAASDANRETALLAALGFQACRFDFSWGNIQPQRGTWNWALFDNIFAQLEKYRIDPLPVVSYSTRWASTGDPNAKKWEDWANAPPVNADYANFAVEAVKRYGRTTKHWELWNEPDIGFWHGTAEQYATLFDTAAKAMKAIDPKLEIMNGGFSETLRRPDFIPTWASAIKVKPDIYAFHSHMAFSNMARANDYVDKIYAKTGWAMPRWLNEAGFSSTGTLTERDQAVALVKKMAYAPALGISGYFWYDLRNDGNNRADSESNYGLVNADFTPKAASVAARTLLTSLSGLKYLRRLTVPETPNAYVLLFGSTNSSRGAIVAWNEAESTLPLYCRVPEKSTNRTMMGLETKAMVKSGLASLTLSPTPQFVVFDGAPEKVAVTARLLSFASPVVAAPGASATLRIAVQNPLATPLIATLNYSTASSWTVSPGNSTVTVPANRRKELDVVLRAPASIAPRGALQISVTSPSLPAAAEAVVQLRQATVIPRVTGSPLGDLSAWSAPTANLATVVNLYEATPMQELLYHGENDLSAKLYLGRAPEGLRVALKVHDDVFSQAQPVGAEWQGDSIQFALALPGGESYEWTAALTASGPIVALGVAPVGVPLGRVTIPESIRREGNDVVYDLVIPETLPGGRKLGERFSFTVLVNDNDGAGRKGWVEWTPGIGRSKDPTQYQTVVVR
ncbi:MAG TPA: hypothetical protein VGK19_04810 [Capsulimonadaceae bacterium]